MRHLIMFDFAEFQTTPFLDLLAPESTARLRASARRRSFADGQFIHSRGDESPGLSIVEDGAAQAGIYSAKGSFVLTSYIGRGHTFGDFTVFTKLPRTHDISAVGPTTILDVPATRFRELCAEDPSYLEALMQTTLMRSHLVLEMLHAVRSLPLLPRVAKFLLILSPSGPMAPTVRFRQTDLASTLGVSRASMNKALAQLQQQGLIERGYGHVKVRNRRTLASWLNTQSD